MEEPWNQSWHICSLGSNNAACSQPWGCLQTCHTTLADRAGVMPPGSGCKTAAPIIQLRLVSWVTTTVNQISCTLWFIFPLSYPSLCYGLLIWFWDSDLSPALFAYIVSQWDPDLGPEIQMILRYNQTATVTEQLFKNQLKNGKMGYATSRSDLVSWRSRIKVK